MWIVVMVVLLAALISLFVKPGNAQSPKTPSRGRMEFFSKGKDAGFSFSEIKLLWEAAQSSQMENPPAIFGSMDELEKAINHIVGNRKMVDRPANEPETQLIKKLFDYRMKAEMSRPKYRSGLKSTREIAIGQMLTIRSEGAGIFTSQIVENEPAFLTITIPVGNSLPPGFSWRQSKLNVYCWRKDDAGYFFQSRLIEQFHDRRRLHFRIHHSDAVLRSQKRRSVRSPARIPAQFYRLSNLDDANQWMESDPGVTCLITNLSEDGAAMRIGGRGSAKNQAVKLQFKIRNETVILCGAVKKVVYSPDHDESTLHLEFLPPPESVRLILLAYVFDIDRSREEEENAPDALDAISGLAEEEEEEEEEVEELESVNEDE